MGTHAQFFVGNPQDLEGREYLGSLAWDGYPDSSIGEILKGIWDDDLFLTDRRRRHSRATSLRRPTRPSLLRQTVDDFRVAVDQIGNMILSVPVHK